MIKLSHGGSLYSISVNPVARWKVLYYSGSTEILKLIILNQIHRITGSGNNAIESRNLDKKIMIPPQITEAQEQVRECVCKEYKDC